MSDKKEPQSFAVVIGEADRGRVDKILSADLARVVDHCTSKASLHEAEWKGEMSLKVKVTAEPHGKVVLGFTKTVKVDEEKMPKARMFYDPDSGSLQNEEPRQLKIKMIDDIDRGPAKSASAPRKGGEA